MSDVHKPIMLELKYQPNTQPLHCLSIDNATELLTDDSTNSKEKITFKWNESISNLFQEKIHHIDMIKLEQTLNNFKQCRSQEHMDNVCSSLNSVLLNVAKDCGASRISQKNIKVKPLQKKLMNKPWFDNECYSKRKQYFRNKNRLRRTKKTTQVNAHEEETKIAKEYKKFIKKKAAAYKKRISREVRNLKNSNSKAYWNLINSSKCKENMAYQVSMESFVEHFRKIGNMEKSNLEENEDSFNVINEASNEYLDKEFSVNELLTIAKKLKNNKACGIDNIRNEFIKNCSPEMFSFMKDMFNVVLNTGILPTDWCIGIIVPIYKNKGPSNNPDNYRGITLLSCLGKFFTACLNSRIADYLEKSNILGNEQAGFREGFSTTDHIFALHSIINIYLNRKQRLYCAFVDYKKAFDLVNRSHLWCKLIDNNITGKILIVINNLYKNAKSCISKHGMLSDFFTSNVGVRQGENLSPILFAVYLNDFKHHISQKYNGLDNLSHIMTDNTIDDDTMLLVKMYTLLYADDTIVLAESADELQKALNAVHEYCEMWDLSVNASKTKIVIFSRGKVQKYPTFCFGDSELEVVDSYIYLGIQFNYNGKFRTAIGKQIQQARKALFSMLAKVKALYLPIDIQLDLFDKLVLPVLTYGCEIWGFESLDKVEIFYRKFLKTVLKVKNRTPSVMVYGETGTKKIELHIKNRMISFWSRLLEGKQNKLSYIFYKLTRLMHGSDQQDFTSKWIHTIKTSLDSAGLSYIWDHEMNGYCSRYVKLCFKQRQDDIYQQNWYSELNKHPKCYFYRMFKYELKLENYLCKLSPRDACIITKYRCHYQIEEYVENDKCPLCDKSELPDAFHYLFKCEKFINERRHFLKKKTFNCINIFHVQKLMNCNVFKKLNDLSKFMNKILTTIKYY